MVTKKETKFSQGEVIIITLYFHQDKLVEPQANPFLLANPLSFCNK